MRPPSDAPPLSNRLADLAERAGEAARAYRRGSIEAIRAYLKAGELLAEARGECRRGEWGAVLARAGIAPRTGRLMAQAARLACERKADAEAIHEAGGIQAFVAGGEKPALSAGIEAPEPAAPNNETAPAARARQRRKDRRKSGQCVACGKPADGHARCPDCRAREAARTRSDRAMRRALSPRLAEAAAAGDGLTLTAAEVATLADPAR